MSARPRVGSLLNKEAAMKALTKIAGLAILGAAVALAAGCANSKREQTLQTGVSSMNNVSVMLGDVNARIDGAYEAMNQLKVQGVDQAAAAKNLTERVEQLDESAEEVRAEARRMRSLGDSYFVEWEREHARRAGADTDAVAVSQAERASYTRVTDAMDIAGTDFRELSEALRALQADVADGFTQAEITPVIERANMKAIDARNAITALQGQLDRITANYRAQFGR